MIAIYWAFTIKDKYFTLKNLSNTYRSFEK